MKKTDQRVVEVAEADFPTYFSRFRIAFFEVGESATELVALLHGNPRAGDVPLVRFHSECFTGDTLGSLRCDCGEQLEMALSLIAASSCGVLLYLPQEGRGIGLSNKIRAYALQDGGLDTVDANTALGLPVDGRDYAPAVSVLRYLGIEQVRLLTNNPLKQRAVEQKGIRVVERVPLEATPNPMNLSYLRTKATRMGHFLSLDGQKGKQASVEEPGSEADWDASKWEFSPSEMTEGRPYVTVHYAQTIDGRIATRTGDSQWISGGASLRLAHQLRASHDAVIVGVGTVLADNPRLTVRHVPGRSPLRVIVDSGLRLPLEANVLTDGAAPTLIATGEQASGERVAEVQRSGADVVTLGRDDNGRVCLEELLEYLAGRGVTSVLVEGGRALITSALQRRLVDRFVVCISPKLLGEGIDAVGDLGINHLSEALTFVHSRFIPWGEDLIFDGRIQRDQGRGD